MGRNRIHRKEWGGGSPLPLQLEWREQGTPSPTQLGQGQPAGLVRCAWGGAGPLLAGSTPFQNNPDFPGFTRIFPKSFRYLPYMNLGVFHHSESILDIPEPIRDSELAAHIISFTQSVVLP